MASGPAICGPSSCADTVAGVNPFNSPTEIYMVNYPWGKYLGKGQRE